MTTAFADRVSHYRELFPALKREVAGKPAAFLDGPAGTQVPQSVIDAMADYLSHRNSNRAGPFLTSQESDAALDSAHQAYAEFVGATDPAEISFGQNMTSLTFSMSRALSQSWQTGDEIVVTRLDHDANVTPWILAARDRGVEVKVVDFHREDCTIDESHFEQQLSPQTKLVAIGAASNASGTLNPIAKLSKLAHAVNALVYVDAVHFAPHGLIDVEVWNADFVAFSAYKFFGPHQGILWGKRELLEALEAYKVRPAPTHLPGKWMTGTQSHEGIMGAKAAVDYLADIGRDVAGDRDLSRRGALRAAFVEIGRYEQALCRRLLEGLAAIPQIKVWGITDLDSLDGRCSTVSITMKGMVARELARRLGEQGFFVWAGHYYAIQFTEYLGLEPEGMVRIGLLHYNTLEEVDRLLVALEELAC